METKFRSAISENPAFSTDKAVSLPLLRSNLIGFDGEINVSLSDVIFTNSSGTEFSWANAVANNKVQAYLSYYDASSATASERKFKYVGITGVDDSLLRGNKGYWMYSNEAGNLTLPGVGGSVSTESYTWNKLRFVNASGSEKSVSDVGVFGDNWVDTDLRYWEDNQFKVASDVGSTTTLDSWTGYFIKSMQDNITLIRQN